MNARKLFSLAFAATLGFGLSLSAPAAFATDTTATTPAPAPTSSTTAGWGTFGTVGGSGFGAGANHDGGLDAWKTSNGNSNSRVIVNPCQGAGDGCDTDGPKTGFNTNARERGGVWGGFAANVAGSGDRGVAVGTETSGVFGADAYGTVNGASAGASTRSGFAGVTAGDVSASGDDVFANVVDWQSGSGSSVAQAKGDDCHGLCGGNAVQSNGRGYARQSGGVDASAGAYSGTGNGAAVLLNNMSGGNIATMFNRSE